MDFFISYILPCILAYLIGSISFPILISRIFYKTDIRSHGSGNAGGTNIARTLGTVPGLIVVLLDAFKCVAAVWIAQFLLPGGDNKTIMAIAGLCCIIGHMFPAYFNFKGGKGVASCAGFMLAMSPICFLILITLFIVVVAVSKYISLGSVTAISLTPIAVYLVMPEQYKLSVCLVFVALAGLVIFMHRANIKRLIKGTESKFSLKKSSK